jgi:tol-pal system protein YbgF
MWRAALAAVLMFSVAAPATAQSQSAAQLAVQVQEMQEQMRILTGQVEGLQFQLTQMQTLIERMTEDNEFRFQQLEGGGSGKPQAATDTMGEPAQRLPQTETETGSIQQLPTVGLDGTLDQQPDGLSLDQPMDFGLGDSLDPVLRGGTGTLGSLDPGTDLTFGGGASAGSGDARAQYEAGYDAIVRGDYVFAQDQFEQFIELYPNNPQAADATNWLGEALIQQGQFDDAALVLAEGYKKYQNDRRAPDLMLKLGMALVGSQQQELACRTFVTLENRYSDLTPAFQQRLGEEKNRAQCPV